jgi:type II secretory pathway pseudopilin PulG
MARSRPRPRGQAGLTFVEVLVAFVIVALSSVFSVQLFGQFTRRIAESRERDALGAIVTRDLATIRRTVEAYCDVRIAPCTGPLPEGEGQRAYNPDLADCDSGRLAEAMAARAGFPASTELRAGGDDPASVADVVLERRIEASGNELKVSYATRSGSTIEVRTSTTLVPPALGWCP